MANAFPQTRVPYMSLMFDNSMAGGSSGIWKTLIIGHALTGSPAGLNTPYLISTADQAESLFGAGSILAEQIKSYKNNDQNVETWAIALTEGNGSTAATSKITPKIAAGSDGVLPMSVSGTIALYIAGIGIQVGITATTKPEEVGAAISSAINKNLYVPCTATVDTSSGTVTLTAKHKGAVCNGIDVSFNLGSETFPAGLSFTAEDFAGGAGNPDINAVFNAIKDTRFQGFVNPFSDAINLKSLAGQLQSRWEPTLQNDGFAFCSISKTVQDAVEFGNTLNSQNMCVVNTYGIPTPGYAVISGIAAQCCASAAIDPAMPLSTLPIASIMAPPQFAQFSFSERTSLLNAGVSTFNVVGDTVCIERIVTTYKKNSSGVADESYLNAETVLTLSKIRDYFREKFWSKFNRFKLAEDGINISAGQKIITPKKAKAELIAIYRDLEDIGLVQDTASFIQNVSVEIDKKNKSKMNMLLPPTVMAQLFNVDATIQFRR